MEPLLESAEYSGVSLDGLNQDCLLAILQYLPVKDVIRLRYQSRSLNNAVCEFLRTSVRKLQIFLSADRNFDELERIFRGLEKFKNPAIQPSQHELFDAEMAKQFAIFDPTADWSLLRDQSHFRFEQFISVNSTGSSFEDKVSSLVLFLTNHVPNLTKLALLIHHEKYFRSIAAILLPLRKLKVLFIDVTYFLPHKSLDTEEFRDCLKISLAIVDLPEVEDLYYFPSRFSHKIFRELFLLQSRDFLPKIESRLRVFHCGEISFPEDRTFEKLEEMALTGCRYSFNNILNNDYPVLRKLITNGMGLHNVFSNEKTSKRGFRNVKVLELHSVFKLDLLLDDLGWMPNLTELTCHSLRIENADRWIFRNQTIARINSILHPKLEIAWPNVENIQVTDEEMDEYVAFCEQYFTGLKLFTNQKPVHYVRLEPEVDQ